MSKMVMPEPKTADQITKREFLAYERVRKSGRYNMILDRFLARRQARISSEAYGAILRHYVALMRRWPEVRGRA